MAYEFEYTNHILSIKLWEWQAVKEDATFRIAKHGHDEDTYKTISMAEARIKELHRAIMKLSNP